MVGHMSALGHACLNGTTAHLVPLKIAWRFRLAFHLRSQGAEFNLQVQTVKINGSSLAKGFLPLKRAFVALKRALAAALHKGLVKFTESHQV